MNKLHGVIIPVVSPLTPRYALDEAGLRRLVSFLLDCRVHGIFANGSMGGFALLPDREQFRVIERTAALVERRVPVLAGASETSVARVLEKIRVIERSGVDAVVVLSPYYYVLRQDEIKRFFLKIADSSRLPVILYDNPRMTNNPIEVETIVELARHENIRGLKVSTPDVFKWQELLRADLPRDRFALIAGVEKMMNLPLQLGFDGITGGLHNLIPNVAVELYEAIRAGDFAAGDQVQQRINRFHKVFEIDGGWRATEIAFRFMGICEKVTAEQFETGTPAEKERQIIDILRREKVLRPYPEINSIDASRGSSAPGADGDRFDHDFEAVARAAGQSVGAAADNALTNRVE